MLVTVLETMVNGTYWFHNEAKVFEVTFEYPFINDLRDLKKIIYPLHIYEMSPNSSNA